MLLVENLIMSGGGPTDPYFENVALLLHGDGTNGGQNNTFIDSSSNNFTITRNGNTTQGSFNPYGTLWSNYFDGTGDYLTAPDNAAFQFGTGDFTIEAWINLANTVGASSDNCLIVGNIALGSTTNWSLILKASTRYLVFYAESTGGTTSISSTTAVNFNEWAHVAVSRTGGTVKLFLNGTQAASAADSLSYKDISYPLAIGADGNGNGTFGGYISNVRIVKGTAVYTANFTPPISPLTAISNTSLLTCQSNRFIDNSTNNFTITRNGDTRVTSFAPFAPTSFYTTGLGASGYFDGTDDYLSIADNVNLRPGAGAFTIEAWIYRNVAGAAHTIFAKGGASTGIVFQVTSSNTLQFTHTTTNITSTGTIAACAWTHVAVVREGAGTDQTKLYINGTADGQGTVSTDFTQTEEVRIGTNRGATEDFNGHISNLRFVKGTAVYTANFSPPTSPLTAITNTQLLCSFTNAAIFDSAAKNDLETVGNAQIDTGTKKFGTGSIEFDGTGDWLLLPDNPDLQLGTGNLTVEFWVYLATGDTGSNRGLVSKGTASTGWSVSLNTTQKVVFSYASSTITSSGAITLDAWNHIAVVRAGTGSNQTKIYINGTNDGTGTVSTDFNQTNVMYIGANRAAGDPMKGFIDELRITKGVARYTANFTPPTRPFPDK